MMKRKIFVGKLVRQERRNSSQYGNPQFYGVFESENGERLEATTATSTDKRCAWNDFTDCLCKSGEISDYQYSNWTQPSFCKQYIGSTQDSQATVFYSAYSTGKHIKTEEK